LLHRLDHVATCNHAYIEQAIVKIGIRCYLHHIRITSRVRDDYLQSLTLPALSVTVLIRRLDFDGKWLLLWQFSIPVLLANLIAWPVAWYYLRGWLQGYAYRISLNPLYFLAAGTIALAIAWATVIVHTVLTASANPIRALRYE